MANIKRLKRLVVVLERVAADPKKRREFDLDEWAEVIPDCGTHMCACGWAASDRVLRSQGLAMTRSSESHIHVMCYGHHRDWEAVNAFFDLNWDESRHLFDKQAYSSRTNMRPVIARIKKFIAGERP